MGVTNNALLVALGAAAAMLSAPQCDATSILLV